jgi:fucose permease
MPQPRSRLLLIGIAYLGFVSLGLPDGLLGVGWPSIRGTFGLPLDALGGLLLTFTAGYLVSSFSSGRILARIGVGTLLASSCLATAASLLGYALAPTWWVMVAFGALSGFGGGAIDAGLNTYVATHHGARTLNWLHASFGVGAMLGPLLMTGLLGAGFGWQWGYAIVGGAQLLLALCFGLTRGWWTTPGSARAAASTALSRPASRSRPVSGTDTLRLPLAWLGIALFFLYTGLEAAAGQWAFSLFTEARAVPPTTAGLWVGVYWGSLTVGRVLFGLVVGVAPLGALLRACLIATVVGAALLWLDLAALLSFLGLALIGLAIAPIFPSLIAATPARLGEAHTANAVGFQIAAAVLGGAFVPAAIGVLAGRAGLEVIPPSLLIVACLVLILHEVLAARSTRPSAARSASPGIPRFSSDEE